MQRSRILIFLLVVSIILKLVGKVTAYLADVSMLFGFVLYLHFVYTKAMDMLNRQFKTTKFKRDFVLRFGYVATFFTMFVLLDLYTSGSLFSLIFADGNLITLDLTSFLSLSIGLILSLSVLFSWRLGKKHQNLVERIFKKIQNKEEARTSVAYIRGGGIKKAYMVWTTGLMLGLLALVFFFFWFIMYIIDYAYLAFLGGWLFYEAVFIGRLESHMFRKTINKSTEMKEDVLFWQTLTRGLMSNVSGVSVVLMIMLSIIMSCGFLVISARYPSLLLSWLLFFGWYLLIVTIQIARRLNQALVFLAEGKKQRTTACVPYEKLGLLTLSILYAYLWVTDEHTKVVLVERLMEPTPLLVMVVLANVLAVYSGIRLCIKPSVSEERATWKNYLVTKAKLAWVVILANLLFATAFAYALTATLVLTATVLLFCFEGDIKIFFPRMTTLKYGLINAAICLLIGIGLITALQLAAQYASTPRTSWDPIILPLSLIWILLVIWIGIASYLSQRDRLNSKVDINDHHL